MTLSIEYEWEVANIEATAQAFLALNENNDFGDPITTEAAAIEFLLERLRKRLVVLYSDLSEEPPKHDHMTIYNSVWVAIRTSFKSIEDGKDRVNIDSDGLGYRMINAVSQRESGILKFATLEISHPLTINAYMDVTFLTKLRNL